MFFGLLALTTAALFTGAAIYVNVAEHPARLKLDDAALLAEWKPSYKNGRLMQAGLAAASGLLAIIAFFFGWNYRWLLGAVFILAPWPYTLYVLAPTNDALTKTEQATITPATRLAVQRWGWLHAGRSAMGTIATLLFLWAASAQAVIQP
jgi:hypothetical protein